MHDTQTLHGAMTSSPSSPSPGTSSPGTSSPSTSIADSELMAAMRSSRPASRGAVRAYDWLTHHCAHRPLKEAIRELATQRRFTYADLDHRANAVAAWLSSLGVGRGDRVALLAHNGVEYFDTQFACGRTGSIAVLLNWRLTVAELEYILNDSSPKILIHDVEFTAAAQELQRRCGIESLMCINPRAGSGQSGQSGQTVQSSQTVQSVQSVQSGNAYEAMIGAFNGKPVNREELTHDDVSTIMYTSGTTGHPKGAMITYGMNFWNCVNLGIPVGMSLGTVHLSVLPLFHTGGLNCYSNPVLHAGGTVVIMRTFDPGLALQIIGDPAYGITTFFAVPAPYQFMAQHTDFAITDLTRLRSAGVGGAPCALTILQTWAARGVHLMQGFGMTETSPA